MPKVTVAMPVFNDAPFLKESIDSILFQSFKDITLLIVDDGSTDSSFDILSKYNDKRIKIVRHPYNMGRPAARNTALQFADSKYFAWMDADDIALPQRLQYQVDFLDMNPGISICGSKVQYFNEAKGYSNHPKTTAEITATTLFHPALPNPTTMMRLDIIKKHGLTYDLRFKRAQDFAFWIDAFIEKQLKGFVLPTPLLRYRVFTRPTNQEWHTNVIRFKLIPTLGIICTPEEIDIHAGIVVGNRENLIQKYGLTTIFDWFDKLNTHCHKNFFSFSPIVTTLLHAFAERIISSTTNPLKAIKTYQQYKLARNHNSLLLHLGVAARWGKRILTTR